MSFCLLFVLHFTEVRDNYFPLYIISHIWFSFTSNYWFSMFQLYLGGWRVGCFHHNILWHNCKRWNKQFLVQFLSVLLLLCQKYLNPKKSFENYSNVVWIANFLSYFRLVLVVRETDRGSFPIFPQLCWYVSRSPLRIFFMMLQVSSILFFTLYEW